mmetsp:Transcript_122247/g.279992  ORF Transcript_122247/g.279992 Transcript_122247/m.279992 type:complete len:206 (+) Transcript_122247:3022-3639(+)
MGAKPLSLLESSGSALCSKSTRAAPPCPAAQAACRAVVPVGMRVSTEALAPRRISQIFTLPCSAASIRAVLASPFFRKNSFSTAAFASSSTLQTCSAPEDAAMARAVCPSALSDCPSTPPATASSSTQSAARASTAQCRAACPPSTAVGSAFSRSRVATTGARGALGAVTARSRPLHLPGTVGLSGGASKVSTGMSMSVTSTGMI